MKKKLKFFYGSVFVICIQRGVYEKKLKIFYGSVFVI